MRSLVVLLLLLPAVFANGHLPIVVDPPAAPVAEASLLAETNAARVRYGLPSLAPDEGLARAARAHAAEMAELDFFSHTSPTPASANLSLRLARAGVPSVTAAENLALLTGPQDLAASAVQGWLESPPHRAALLHTDYTHVGFGVFEGRDDQTFIAQVFSREPRSLLDAVTVQEARSGFELAVALDLPRGLTVLPRLSGSIGEPYTLESGRRELLLHAQSAEKQQLVLAAPLANGGGYVIQDGGWVTPGTGEWQADPSMPRSGLSISGVSARPARGAVIRVELAYEPRSAPLAVFVDGQHYRDAEVAPGRLRLHLPGGQPSRLQVGEVAGRNVTPFDEFTVVPTAEGPRLQAGSAP